MHLIKIRIWIFLVLICILQSCHNFTCSCTEVACFSPDAGITVSLNLQEHPELQDRNEVPVLVKRVTYSYTTLDSTYTYFKRINSDLYSLEINSFLFNEDVSFKDYNYIMRFTTNNRSDTISEIQYDIKKDESVCNQCSGIACKDEYFTTYTYQNFRLLFNDSLVESSIIKI